MAAADLDTFGKVLADANSHMKDRMRALFTLCKQPDDLKPKAIDLIKEQFKDPSALLKHELAYCLGQMQDEYAIPTLVRVLEDTNQEAIVRHEAGEALGAIGNANVIDVLEKYTKDPIVELADTCQLAIARIKWFNSCKDEEKKLSVNPFKTVDPAPPSLEKDIGKLKATLLDESLPLFDRYRALFALRNMASTEACLAIAEGLKVKSALFRHEIAYVLGMMGNKACVQQLADRLKDSNENHMVRHECAEALGSIASEESREIIKNYCQDNESVVKESCDVALNDYDNPIDLAHADTLAKLKQGQNLMVV